MNKINYSKILQSMKSYEKDNGGKISLSDWFSNAVTKETTTYEVQDATKHFIASIRPETKWVELDM